MCARSIFLNNITDHWKENYHERENNLIELFKVQSNFNSNQIMQDILKKPRRLRLQFKTSNRLFAFQC